MDTHIQSAMHEIRFRLKFVESTGESFQDLFSSVMELRYPSDFIRVRPWGKSGDRKNDGYLRSKRQLFQCFAPQEWKPISKCTRKIKLDFKGALPHWKEYFDTWIFSHNSVPGVPPEVLTVLLELTNRHNPITATQWGYNELLAEFKCLSRSNMETLLGPAPGLSDVVGVDLADVRSLLEHISLQPERLMPEVKPVPVQKLEYNQLSNAVGTLLKAGMTRAEVVRKYLRSLADQTRHDRVAAAFRDRYRQLKAEGFAPDDIFSGLQKFVVGDEIPNPSRQAAALAILAFFFEACDIFERPIA